MTIKTINPATGELLETYAELSAAAVGAVINDVHTVFLQWRRIAFAERAAPMRRAAEILRAEAGGFSRLMAREMGKPLRELRRPCCLNRRWRNRILRGHGKRSRRYQ